MRVDNATSASASGTTSAAARQNPTKSPDAQADAVKGGGVGEAAYLTRQAQLAQQAILRTVGEIKQSAARAADPRVWVQHYPWSTMGVTAVAGFVAAAMLIPSKEEQALKKLAAIERAMNPKPAPREREVEVDGDGKAPSGEHAYKAGKQSIGRAILGEVIGALKPAVVSLLTAGVAAATAKPSHEEMKAAAHAADAGKGWRRGRADRVTRDAARPESRPTARPCAGSTAGVTRVATGNVGTLARPVFFVGPGGGRG